MTMEEQITQQDINIVLDDLGFVNTPLEQRAVVFCQLLKSLNIMYRKYYTTPPISSMRSRYYNGDNWSCVGMVFVVSCEKSYAEYVAYLYKERMSQIEQLNKLLVSA